MQSEPLALSTSTPGLSRSDKAKLAWARRKSAAPPPQKAAKVDRRKRIVDPTPTIEPIEEPIMEMTPPPRAEPKPLFPRRIKLTRPFGYINDDGQQLHWFQGQIIDDPDTIVTIVDRHCVDFVVME